MTFPFFKLQKNLGLNAELTEIFYLMSLNDSQSGQKANSSFLGFILHRKIERYRTLSLRSKSQYDKHVFGSIFFKVFFTMPRKYYEALLGPFIDIVIVFLLLTLNIFPT